MSEHRTFKHDHRHNPRLHRMYVGWALETLRVVDEFLEEMNSHSRITSTLFAGVIHEERLKTCQEDAAFFEAAALLHMHADTSEYDQAVETPTRFDDEEAVSAEETASASSPTPPADEDRSDEVYDRMFKDLFGTTRFADFFRSRGGTLNGAGIRFPFSPLRGATAAEPTVDELLGMDFSEIEKRILAMMTEKGIRASHIVFV